MIINKIIFPSIVAISTSLSACKKNEGCTDKNANNYDSNADENSGCVYRYASTVNISGVSSNNPNGAPWDIDGGPDLRINFGKNSSSAYDFSTDIKNNVFATTLTPTSNIQFTNEAWKYQVVDEHLLSFPEKIATGTFNPITQGGSNEISINNGSIIIKFNYTVN